MNWGASAVQFPAKQGEVAVVLRGPEGAGKGLFARALKALFGAHGKQITNASHLVGRFNAHLQCCVFLFADEAFFAGDKTHRNVLFTLISEPTQQIEAKFKDAAEAQNYLHIMMATNEEWAVPSSINDRRFLVLDVLPLKIGDSKYFTAITNQLEKEGGYEAMLHELMNRDISKFNVSKIPNTAAMDDQKLLSLSPLHKWWLEVLERGYVWRSERGLEETFGRWHTDMSTDLLCASYAKFAKERGDRYPKERNQVGRFLSEVAVKKQYAGKGTVLMGESFSPINKEYTARMNIKSEYGYKLGTLEEARKAFERLLKISIPWSEPALDVNSDDDGGGGGGQAPDYDDCPF